MDVHTIITLTDDAPRGLNKSLSSFPHATKVRCSSTPFEMGKCYTLFCNGSVNSSGAVGITLSSAGPRPTADDISLATRHNKGRG
ncbi:hypothetical protein BGW80DRAFT_1388664 [Lactifluus volemus]|nr:hypothetical protein BGW80DRAFT_1388664 [Lactifluus volemus]